ncbi:MAG: hypothetical protein J0M11_12420 [Anaerolineae bacterium]|nr:hypothetical protein [Anaerolineae bacterium]
MNFDYGNILTRSFQITWKHKSFWLFMMFPTLIASVMFIAFAAPVFLLSENNDEMMGLAFAGWVGVLFLGTIINLVVSTAGTTSLTLGILRVERGEGATSFLDLVRDGFQYFGRAFGAVMIIQLSIGAVFTVFFLCIAMLSLVTMGLASICLQPITLLLTPFSFLVVAVMDGALVAIIDEGLGAWDAVKRALGVVREHVWKFLIITLIVYLGVSVFSGFFVVPVMIPAMALPIMMESGMEIGAQEIIVAMLAFACLFFPLMSIFSGVTGALMTSVLNLSYLRLTQTPEAEIVVAPESAKDATS